MVGCFNISLYMNFDVHRIFDLIMFRLWDFVLWWFDLDFILFDFNFDFILCLSFLFIFLIHFFIKVIFSFLSNYIVFNTIINIFERALKGIIFLGFITFFFISSLLFCTKALELYFMTRRLCFIDFIGFHELSKNNIYCIEYTTTVSYFFMLFYFTLTIINYILFILTRFFFSKSYCINLNVDYVVSITAIDIKYINIMTALIITSKINTSGMLYFLYAYTLTTKLNIILINSLISIFYAYKNKMFTVENNIVLNNFKKTTRYLYNMNICYSIIVYKNIFSNVTLLFIVNYIIFTINFFGTFIKDFIHINIVLNYYNISILHTTGHLNFNANKYMNIWGQLRYSNYN